MFEIGAEALKAALPHLQQMMAKGATLGDVVNQVSGGGYGGRNMNVNNTATVQGQTQPGYAEGRDDARNAGNILTDKMLGANDTAFYRNIQAGNAQRQSDFINQSAMADQQARAGLADSAIRSYDNARQANTQFLNTLNQAGAGRMY